MFAEMEIGLVDVIEASPLAQKLTKVGTLPDIDGDNLVKRMAADAPAVYVVVGQPAVVSDGSVRISYGLACVARNARGHEEARRGDGLTVGVYAMIESVLGLVENGQAGGYLWRVTGIEFMTEAVLTQNGLTVGVVTVETLAALPNGIDETALAALSEFTTLRADYDIKPMVVTSEHNKWIKDDPDYSSSKPELQDQQTVQT
ncbi:MAG: hypothetical protein CO071_00170 [Gallionellales bacterium CG_4_9_14_0_8_um_filter_59_50]|nr:MAG: hypothetical protein CO071_00170 [Gallionellales bacterium CG_4_9_14_0_8_um_filter_59_50]